MGETPEYPDGSGRGVAVFGTFFPDGGRAGNSTTGIVAALSDGGQGPPIIVFAQSGSGPPNNTLGPNVQVVPTWRANDVISILRSFLIMRARSPRVSTFVFNTYVTAYGKSLVANAAGLLLGPLISITTRKPVIVYMHNFAETQDVVGLGYQPSWFSRVGVHLLELAILRLTTTVVPLESQATTIKQLFGIEPKCIPLPYAEPFGLSRINPSTIPLTSKRFDGPARILLLGAWGPQKDLSGALVAIRAARLGGASLALSISGQVNPNFPEFISQLESVGTHSSDNWITPLGVIAESNLLTVVNEHDLVILPYRASGGYSGAMSIAAYCGLEIISYDLPQLRETANLLKVPVWFVKAGDADALTGKVLTFCQNVDSYRRARIAHTSSDCDERFRQSVKVMMRAARQDSRKRA